MISSARAATAFALLALAAGVTDMAAQTPVVTLTASTTRIAERLVLTRTTSPTLTTTTTTTTRTGSTVSTAPTANAATFTVTRTGPTDLSDLTVRYTVSGSALNGKDYSSLSGTVTIPRTQSSATFTVTAIDDSDDELDETIVVNLTSTATSPYVLSDPASATVTIVDDDDVRLVGLDIESDSILAGGTVAVRVTLSGAAPTGGVAVPLSASDGSVTVPTIAIAAGTRTGIGQIGTTTIAAQLAVVVSGSAGGVTGRDTLVLFPPPTVQRVELNRDVVFGGVPVYGTVYLESPAPPIVSGVDLRARIVLQTASRTTVGSGTSFSTVSAGTLTSPPITIPSTASLTPGATTATFDVQTDAVTTSTNVELTALIGSSSARTSLAIHPVPSIASSTYDPNPVEGGEDVTWSLQLEEPIPAGLSLSPSVTSSSSYVSAAGQGGARVYFAAGSSQWTGRLSTRAVRSRETACLIVNLPGSNRASAGCLTLLPPAITDFSINRDAQWGGAPISGTIAATRPVGGGYPVRLSVDVLSPAGATSPLTSSRVTIPTGESSTLWTLQTSAVTEATTVRIEAPGGAADTITIHPVPSIASSTYDPDPVEGGEDVTWSLQLEEPIPAGLALAPSVTSSSSYVSAAGQGGARVYFAAGSSQWTGQLSTRAVRSRETVCLLVNLPGANRASAGCLTLLPPAITDFSINGDAQYGGTPVSGTITATRPVGGGYPVRLSVAVLSPAGATSPITASRVTIPSGQNTTTWTLQTSAVTSETTVRIEAEGGAADTITIHPLPTVAIVDFSPDSVTGGNPAPLSVRLATPVPAGLSFDLTLVGQLGVLPSGSRTVQVRGGQTEWTGSVETAPVNARTIATLRVNGGIAHELILLPRPPAVIAFGVQPRAVIGGNPVSFTVQLDRAAPAGGIPVSLRSSTPGVLQLPPGITVPAGSDRATFQATTSGVGTQQIVDFEASANGGRAAGQLRVDPQPMPSVTSLRTSAVNNQIFGGTTIGFIVDLDRPAPAGGTVVQLQTNRPDILDLTSITVAAGATSGSVTVRAEASDVEAVVNTTAGLGPSQATVTLTVRPQPIDRVQMPNTVQAGTQSQGFVRLSQPAPPNGMLVPLASSNPSAATLPPFVLIPAGQTQVNFNVNTSAVAQNTEVTVTAGAGVATATFRIRAR